MRSLHHLLLLGAVTGSVMRIDPETARMVMSTITVGSGASLPPRVMQWTDSMLKNPVSNWFLSSTIKSMDKHRNLVTKLGMRVMNKVSIFQTEDLTPNLSPNNTRKRVRYGPIVLPGANEVTMSTKLTNEKGSRYGMDIVQPFCRDCFVYEGNAYLTHENGREATPKSGIYNHHAVLMNLDRPRRILECTSGPEEPSLPSPFMAVVEESGKNNFRSSDGKILSGYYVKPKDRFLMFSEFMNYKPEPQIVFVTFDVEYRQGQPEGQQVYDSQTMQVNIGPCIDAGFIPQTSQLKKEGNWTVPTDMYITEMVGHMHDGGKNVTFALNGKNICNSIAKYSPVDPKKPSHDGMDGMEWMKADNSTNGGLRETISEMTKCTQTIRVKKGDVFSLESNYDLDAHGLRKSTTGSPESVMGLAAFMVATEPGTVF